MADSSHLSETGMPLVKEVDVTQIVDRDPAPQTTGKVIHWAFAYDLLVSVLWLGREGAFRKRVVELASLKPGESVLDVGCGTGTLAIAAKRCVGPQGRVSGIDPSPEMIQRARKKARKSGIEIIFENAAAEKLPFPDAAFDCVLSTVMLHHLPEEARRKCLSEIRRVLKPGGRLLAVDFGGPAEHRRSLVAHFRQHMNFDLRKVIPMLDEVGLNAVQSGPVGFSDLHFVLAAAPSAA
jgi:ubiquinone/menaquinone biosynthesis C-methylase UbiE